MAKVAAICGCLLLGAANAEVVKPMSALATQSRMTADSESQVVLETKIGDMKAVSPGFGEESCQGMFSTKMKLGGSVPPNDFVTGCTEVCASIKAMKEYWGSGDMASYACAEAKKFGCVYDGTPPVTAADIGC
eukprot:TRINITY_DN9974_c1_g1_i1.p1 TRINITY_DN9974_c1_g1~~TRINITY_DN9974_c1_g1_i1.p1  ORF type:complete len:133 (-),score=43.88 TRINITY_DN9974_c1_g1_i1:59-457(-)